MRAIVAQGGQVSALVMESSHDYRFTIAYNFPYSLNHREE